MNQSTLISDSEVSDLLDSLDSVYSPVYRASLSILRDCSPGSRDLYSVLRKAVPKSNPSDYAYVFKYVYEMSGRSFLRVLGIASALHVLQASTFVVDDVLDGADRRYDSRSIAGEYGEDWAIIVGNILQNTALATLRESLARAAPKQTAHLMSLAFDIVDKVYKGQLLDIQQTSNIAVSVKEYYRCITLTTAQFVERVAEIAGILGQLPRAHIEAAKAFGYHYGLALQVADDVLDVVCSSNETGKTFAVDLKAKRLRLPLIIALDTAPKAARSKIARFVLSKEPPTQHEIREILRLVAETGAIGLCAKRVHTHVNDAIVALGPIPSCTGTRMLDLLARGITADIGGDVCHQ